MRKVYIHILFITAFLFISCLKEDLKVYDKNRNVSIVISDSTVIVHHHYKCMYKNLGYGEYLPYNKIKSEKFNKKYLLPKGEEVLHIKKWEFSLEERAELIERLVNILSVHEELVKSGMVNEVPDQFFNIEVDLKFKIDRKHISIIELCNYISKYAAIDGVYVGTKMRNSEKATINIIISKIKNQFFFSAPQLNAKGAIDDSLAMKELKLAVDIHFARYAFTGAGSPLHPRVRRLAEARYIKIIPDYSICKNIAIEEILHLHKPFSKFRTVTIFSLEEIEKGI